MSLGLISAPDGVPAPASRVECRVYQRHACEVTTSCQPAGSGETRWEAVIRNVSQGGACVILRRRFERNSCLALELPGKDGEDAYTVFVRVIHLLPEPGGCWALGCQFISALSEEELQRLLAAGQPDQLPDEQTPDVVTVPGIVSDVRLRVECPGGALVRCRVERLHVRSSWPMAAGQTVHLSGIPINGAQTARRYRVLDCESQGPEWQLRLQLLEPLAAAPGCEL